MRPAYWQEWLNRKVLTSHSALAASGKSMNDPHVEWLEYDMNTGWRFQNPSPLDWTTPVFKATLKNGVLRADMLKHFATVEEAKAAIEPYLQTWEIGVGLEFGERPMEFVFKQAHILDRNPNPAGSGAGNMAFGGFSISGKGQITLQAYPAAPANFIAVPNVVTLWNRLEGFRKGHEPLASMAYFCFTVIKKHYGGANAAKLLAIDNAILRKMSELSTNRGDDLTARKMTRDLKPFTPTEARWLDAAIRAVIRRIGEIAAGDCPKQLTMSDLPPL